TRRPRDPGAALRGGMAVGVQRWSCPWWLASTSTDGRPQGVLPAASAASDPRRRLRRPQLRVDGLAHVFAFAAEDAANEAADRLAPGLQRRLFGGLAFGLGGGPCLLFGQQGCFCLHRRVVAGLLLLQRGDRGHVAHSSGTCS